MSQTKTFMFNMTREEVSSFHLFLNMAEEMVKNALIVRDGNLNDISSAEGEKERRTRDLENIWHQFEPRMHALGWCEDPKCTKNKPLLPPMKPENGEQNQEISESQPKEYATIKDIPMDKLIFPTLEKRQIMLTEPEEALINMLTGLMVRNPQIITNMQEALKKEGFDFEKTFYSLNDKLSHVEHAIGFPGKSWCTDKDCIYKAEQHQHEAGSKWL